jgi:hypothetical protein
MTAAVTDQPEISPPAPTPAAIEPVEAAPQPALDPAGDQKSSHRQALSRGALQPRAGFHHRIGPPDGLVAAASPADSLAGPSNDVELAPGAGPAPTPGDSRTASVVRIIAGTRAGSAVYVRPDLVLTTAALVAGSAVVEIATADGARVLGLVARADQARNLALVQVARPGPPVAVYDGPRAEAGSPIEAIALAEDAGVLVTPGHYRGGGAIPGAAGSISVGLAQVEVRAPPVRPEGLPWFLGDRVIAIGTGPAGDHGQNSLFAIQAAEIRDFLYGAGGALAELR